MEDKVFLKLFLVLIISLFFPGITYGGEILFHEYIGEQAVIYRVSPDGTGLREIGHGMFPKWSPDRKFISYVESAPIYSQELSTTGMGQLIVASPEGIEIFRVKEVWKTGNIIRYCWNPKGNHISFATIRERHYGAVSVYDIKTERMKTLHKFVCKDLDEAFIATTLEWSPDGEYLLFSSGSLFSKGQDTVLINPKKGTTKMLSYMGTLPRFAGKDKVIFLVGSEISIIHKDGSDKRRMLDLKSPVVNSSRVVNNKIILQFLEKGMPEKAKLYLFDIASIRLQEIKVKNYLLLCPTISPDGERFTAIGLKLKNGELVSEEEAEPGYYVLNLNTKEVTLLKRFEPDKNEGFWFGVYLGYGNHTSWR